ncbi:MAG TPA: PDZ domain-containing protein [Elusimicrobiota bacterium]|nr:PDZ domain-containing protein [Elusimicrobiota bacterium]
MKLIPLLVALLAAAAPASAAAKRKKKPAARAAAAKAKRSAPAAKASPAVKPAAVETAAPPRASAALSASGLALSEDEDGLLAAAAWPEGAASAMGLRPGDRVWRVNRAAPRTRAEAAAAVLAAAPEERLSLVVRRGLETLPLAGAATPAPPDFARGADDLSGREISLAAGRAAREDSAARDAVAEAAPLDWTLRADQAFWIRFPDGLPAGLKKGDEVSAESATGLTTDGALDFLAVPPKSKVWARVLSASDDGSVRLLRLVFYKLQPAGGRVYPILGAATALAAVPAADLARVSAGGTIAVAAPLPAADGKKPRGKERLLDEDARLRVRLIDPVRLAEAPSWWRAGPGLWLKTASDAAGRRRFQVTHIVAGRSAAASGLKINDVLDGVGGRSSERMDFEEALDALYGPPGSAVKVSVVGPGGSRELTLTRGVKVDAKGATVPLPLPFTAR